MTGLVSTEKRAYQGCLPLPASLQSKYQTVKHSTTVVVLFNTQWHPGRAGNGVGTIEVGAIERVSQLS
jgi:hypothetical protein